MIELFTNRHSKFLIVGILILSSVLFAFHFFKTEPPQIIVENEKVESVAQVESVFNESRIKSSGEANFKSLRVHQELFYGDTLFSGANSHIEVRMVNGSKLRLGSNSLIVLGDKEGVDLAQYSGEVTLALAQGREFSILSEGKPLKLFAKVDSLILLKRNPGQNKMGIAVLYGDVDALGDSQNPVALSKSEQMDLSKGIEKAVTVKFDIHLENPKYGESLWVTDKNPIHFSWTAPSSSRGFIFQLTHKETGESIRRQTGEAFTRIPSLRPGEYQWTVTDLSGAKSETYSLIVMGEKAPKPIFPKQDMEFRLQKNHFDTEVGFHFEGVGQSRRFLLHISSKGDFSSGLRELVLTSNKVRGIRFPKGQYYWRVRVEDPERPFSQWSQTLSFSVKPEAFQLASPEFIQEEYTLLVGAEQSTRIRWAADTESKLFDVLLKYRNSEGEGYKTLHYSTNDLHWQNPIGQNANEAWLYVRALGDTKNTLDSEWSKPAQIVYQLQSPVLNNPKILWQTNSYLAEVQWQKVPHAKDYQVLISDPDDQSRQRTEIVNEPHFQMDLPPGNSVQIQVQARPGKIGIASEYSRPALLKAQAIQRSLASSNTDDVLNELESELTTGSSENLIAQAPAIPILQESYRLEDHNNLGIQNDIFMKDRWGWIGPGLGYMQYSQEVIGNSTGYGGFKPPVIAFSVGSMLTNQVGVEFGYKNLPGEVQGSGEIEVLGSPFNWQIMSAHGLYSLWSIPTDRVDLYMGIQRHDFPFAYPFQRNQIRILENQFTTLSGGARYNFSRMPRMRSEVQLGYQYILNSTTSDSGEFAMSPKYSIDGSFGQIYSLTDQWRLGVFWHGQWHDFDFEYSTDGQKIIGSQKLFNTSIDVRVGFEY